MKLKYIYFIAFQFFHTAFSQTANNINQSVNSVSLLSVEHKDIIYDFLSKKMEIIGLKFKTQDRDIVLRAFEAIIGDEITPENMQEKMDKYSKRVATIESSGKVEKYQRFFRKIADELQDKDIDIVTLDKVAKESDLKIPPQGDVDIMISKRSESVVNAKARGADRLAEIFSQELPKNDNRELITANLKIIGDDLFFSLLTSN